MSERFNGNEPLLPGLRVPQPPEDLRGQALERAREALGRKPRRDRWARLWESRQARLAWAASVLALAAGHLWLSAGDTAREVRPDSAATVAVSSAPAHTDEVAAIADLPRISLEGRPVAASARTRDQSEIELDGAAPTASSEENAS